MENTHKRQNINRRTDYSMNTDMPLDVFAKLCVDECRRLRVEKGQLLTEIDEYNDKITSLEKQLQLKQDIIDLYEEQMQAKKDITKEEIYKQILKENKRLKKMYDDARHEYKKVLNRIIQDNVQKEKED